MWTASEERCHNSARDDGDDSQWSSVFMANLVLASWLDAAEFCMRSPPSPWEVMRPTSDHHEMRPAAVRRGWAGSNWGSESSSGLTRGPHLACTEPSWLWRIGVPFYRTEISASGPIGVVCAVQKATYWLQYCLMRTVPNILTNFWLKSS